MFSTISRTALRNLTKRGITTSQFAMASEMKLTFASPSTVLYSDAIVKQIDVPTVAGHLGILAEHVPSLGVLKPGVVAVTENDGNVKKYFVSSGSLAINDDSSVQVLAEEAVTLDQLDMTEAQKQLKESQSALTSSTDSPSTNEYKKTEAQISVECAEAVIRAIQSGN
ncbi:hypothetical protein SNEBB_003195 [Seison nebaliae]|nr:hypothetical protein SNEBB_003195 [Seison nebaliae]